jgi:hypothetical protein
MPVCSSRTFLYRGELAGPKLSPRVEAMAGETALTKLVLTAGPGLPSDVLEALTVYKGRVYTLVSDGTRLSLRPNWVANAADFLKPQPSQRERLDGRVADLKTVVRRFLPALIARALWADAGQNGFWDPNYIADERLHLFVLAQSPEQFHCTCKRLRREQGYVIYHWQLYPQEASDG